MAVCQYCGTKEFFLKLDSNGMCKNCREKMLEDIEELQYKLDREYTNSMYGLTYEIRRDASIQGLDICEKLNSYFEKGYKGSLIISHELINSAEFQFNSTLDWLERLTHCCRYPEEIHYQFAITSIWGYEQKNNPHILRQLIPNKFSIFYQMPEAINDNIRTDLHFLFQNSLNQIYKSNQLYTNPRVQKQFIELCKKDIDLFLDRKVIHAHVDSFYKLSIFYEKRGKIEDAIKIAELGEYFNIPIHHKEDYFIKRKEKLLKKLK